MIATRFLSTSEYFRYGAWLKSQDAETINTYFGFAVNDEVIDNLVQRIQKESKKHQLLVAEDLTGWVGVIHIAECNVDEVEFGVMVRQDRRKLGIADQMLSEAILWARNRGYQSLFMHCVAWNTPIKRLCAKHGLEVKNYYAEGESETKMPLPKANFLSLGMEIARRNKNVYNMVLQKNIGLLQEIYG